MLKANDTARKDIVLMTVNEMHVNLKCEYLENPLGVQNKKPRFSWTLNNGEAAGLQTKYRILVSDAAQNSGAAAGNVWDSGIVESSKSSGIEFRGRCLESAKRYYWHVYIWLDNRKEPIISQEAWFETGLYHNEDWQGSWIQSPNPQWGISPLFRKSFLLEGGIKDARAYISGIGYYELYINGKRVGDKQLEPGWTDYRKRVLYSTYDITDYLKAGENVVGIQLGEGWYGLKHPTFIKYIGKMPEWNGIPKLICDIRIQQEDGQLKSITSQGGTEGGWLCCDGPIRENSIYDGEIYDARKEKPGWNMPGYNEDKNEWLPAICAAAPGGKLVSQMMPPIMESRRIKPVYAAYAGESVVFDLGLNIAGWVEIKVKGHRGGRVELLYGETLYPDGRVNQGNLRGAKARDIYILKGEGTETYKPRFTYHGFRYVQVNLEPGVLMEGLNGVCVHTNVNKTGHFECSSEIMNRVYQALIQTERNNLHSVPTDCPQRDERLAWLNDMTVRFEEALFNFDMLLFYEKWLDDIADAQDQTTGSIPDTAPYFYGGQPAAHISSVYILLPWYLYLYYGDQQALEKHYKGMKQYVQFLASQTKDGLIKKDYFGDWAPPMTESILGWGENALPANIPAQIITTGYLYYDCIIMDKAAQLLGYPEDSKYFNEIADMTKAAINTEFLDPEKGYYRPNSQGSNAFPLFLDIVPEQIRHKVVENLVDNIADVWNYHTSTGNQATKYLFEVLDKEKLNDIGYKLATQVTYPSIGYMLENGATTIWERWEYGDGPNMNSHDHPMHGAFTVWFYKAIGGIRIENGLTDSIVTIRPNLISGLSFARSVCETPKGRIESQWEVMKDGLVFNINVPWNTLSELFIPSTHATYELIINGVSLISTDGAQGSMENVIIKEAGKDRIVLVLRPGSYNIKLCPV
ncbi:MAG TPA: family 78 glycoside hydrolase catalytic domain [Clostridiales bacterium]|nr:family 78 glycoside hydrolase catalytic domain [Clostridiales bacterium]